jgi:hypothetical protein
MKEWEETMEGLQCKIGLKDLGIRQQLYLRLRGCQTGSTAGFQTGVCEESTQDAQ